MAQSNAEREFRSKYPNARFVVEKDRFGKRFTVYAGDYLCADSHSRAAAFSNALAWSESGLITPDPNEAASTAGHPGGIAGLDVAARAAMNRKGSK